MMANSFKRSLQDDMEEDISAPKRTCIVTFNDCKDEEKFIYRHGIQSPEKKFDKMHEIKEDLQSQEWTESANLYQII